MLKTILSYDACSQATVVEQDGLRLVFSDMHLAKNQATNDAIQKLCSVGANDGKGNVTVRGGEVFWNDLMRSLNAPVQVPSTGVPFTITPGSVKFGGVFIEASKPTDCTTPKPIECTCDIMDLMREGCKCQ